MSRPWLRLSGIGTHFSMVGWIDEHYNQFAYITMGSLSPPETSLCMLARNRFIVWSFLILILGEQDFSFPHTII